LWALPFHKCLKRSFPFWKLVIACRLLSVGPSAWPLGFTYVSIMHKKKLLDQPYSYLFVAIINPLRMPLTLFIRSWLEMLCNWSIYRVMHGLKSDNNKMFAIIRSPCSIF
jgi:hypothetical protein